MSSGEWERAGFTLVAKLSRYGNGVYVRIPKSVIEAYELKSGDVVKVEVKEFHRLFKKATYEQEVKQKDKSKTDDQRMLA